MNSVVALGLCALLGCSSSQSPPRNAARQVERQADSTIESTKSSKALAELFDKAHADGAVHGSVLIAEGDNVVLASSFGFADRDAELASTSETVFPIASITKPIVAIAVVMLRDDGALSLEDPVAKFIVSFPYPSITVRHLLSHTSGLRDDPDGFLATWDGDKIAGSTDRIAALIAAKPALVGKPGDAFAYSNLGYVLLADIVSVAAQVPYRAFVRTRVFGPANMRSASFVPLPNEKRPAGVAVTYVKQDGGWIDDRLAKDYRFLFWLGGSQGDGDIMCTADDLWQLDKALRNGLLKTSSLKEMQTPLVLNSGDVFWEQSWTKQSYGLGWWIGEGGRTVWHTGDWGGTLGFFKRYLDSERVAIVLQNHRSLNFGWVGSLEAQMSKPTL